tara:strand:- start:71 stop:769 length:699 start_codon:yes stop_codon:yes gene_type:complete
MTNHNLRSQKIIKDVAIVGVSVLIIWICLMAIFGNSNPFYVVASGSMIPTLEVNDVIVVESNTSFENINKGDIIVFFSPDKYEKFIQGKKGGEERVIVHRVELLLSEDPKIIKTRGDNNPKSYEGVDYPITEREFIGKVEYIIPQVGYITKILQPPVNYIIIAIIIGVMIMKHFVKKKEEIVFQHTAKEEEEKLTKSEIADVGLDKEYLDQPDNLEDIKEDTFQDSKPNEDK